MAKKKQETKNNKKEKKEVVVKEEKVVKEVPKKESKKESKKDTNKVNDDKVFKMLEFFDKYRLAIYGAVGGILITVLVVSGYFSSRILLSILSNNELIEYTSFISSYKSFAVTV